MEPVKPILEVLKINTKRLSNIEIYPCALGEENKTIQLGNNTFQKSGFVAGGSNYILDQNKQADTVFEAEMKKSSELFSNLDRLDFIKCDIEGYETVVIPELEPIITKMKPILLVEARGVNRIQMLELFERLEYNAFVLNNGELFPAQKDEYRDILFVPPEKLKIVSKYFANQAAEMK